MKTRATAEQIAQAKEKFKVVKEAEIFDSEGNTLGFLLVGTPGSFAIKEFEKWIDKDSMKARLALINGTVCLPEDKEWVKSFGNNSEEYAAVFDAASQMLPVGRAVLKNV